MIYPYFKGLPDNGRFKCLKNYINLISAYLIGIAKTKTIINDDKSVKLQNLDIIYRFMEQINVISMQPYQSTYYLSVINRFTESDVCFLYLNEDNW